MYNVCLSVSREDLKVLCVIAVYGILCDDPEVLCVMLVCHVFSHDPRLCGMSATRKSNDPGNCSRCL